MFSSANKTLDEWITKRVEFCISKIRNLNHKLSVQAHCEPAFGGEGWICKSGVQRLQPNMNVWALVGKQLHKMWESRSTPVLWLPCGLQHQKLEYLSCYFICITDLQNDESSNGELRFTEWNTSFTCSLQMHVTSLTLWRTVLLKSGTSYQCGFCDLVLLWIVSLHHVTCWAGLSWQRVMVSSSVLFSWSFILGLFPKTVIPLTAITHLKWARACWIPNDAECANNTLWYSVTDWLCLF